MMKNCTYTEIEWYSDRLANAIGDVLGVNKNEIFVGNEEKIIIASLINGLHVGDDFYVPRMYDLLRFLEAGHVGVKAQNGRKLIELVRSSMKFALRVKKKQVDRTFALLNDCDNIIHFAAHLRTADYVLSNITDLCYSFPKRNTFLRKKLSKSLSGNGFSDEDARLLVNLIPLSHLESYFQIRDLKILRNIKVSAVCTSIYGVLIDPLLSVLIQQSQAKKVYVQHGGGYGLVNNLKHQIEVLGSDEMLWWGVGAANVYPTRYSLGSPKNVSQVIYFVCSLGAHNQKKFFDYVSRLRKRYGSALRVVGHPRSIEKNACYDQYGVADRDHNSASIIIYDNALHSLIYSRLVNMMPFFIIDGYEYQPVHPNAESFLDLLRITGIMVDLDVLIESLDNMIPISGRERVSCFRKTSSKLNDFMTALPHIKDMYPAMT